MLFSVTWMDLKIITVLLSTSSLCSLQNRSMNPWGWVVDPEMFVFVYWRSWWFLALFNTISRKCLWRLLSYPNEMKGSKNLLRLLCFSREWGLWPWSHLYHLLKCPLSDGLYWNASALFKRHKIREISYHLWKWNRREGSRAQPLKEWHSPRAQYKLIQTKWVQDVR